MADDGEPKGHRGSKSDSYWFAHAAEPPIEKFQQAKKASPTEKQRQEDFSLCQIENVGQRTDLELVNQRTDLENANQRTDLEQNNEQNSENSRFSGYKTLDLKRPGSPVHIDGKEGSPPLSQKEREERIRQFREHQEEERRKRLQELQMSFLQAKKYREQQEEERRRKIEEARSRELERRLAVEERKRQIWEAEQERKEAILRRNLEREARIEARRNAQRNTMSFAFGSSTPRSFDLDLAALSANRSTAQGSFLFPASGGRRSEERELTPGTKRATSACSLERKTGDDSMTQSMVSLSAVNRGRKKTDLIPTVPRDRSATPHTFSRGNQSMRAVSMTRLDQLAQPYRRYMESRDSTTGSAPTKSSCTTTPSMSKSMCNLPNSTLSSRPNRKLTGKETSSSPSRPRSSMSGASEQSATSSQASGASLRPRVTPRRPRPISIAGTVPEKSQAHKISVGSLSTSVVATPNSTRDQQRQGRPSERKTPSRETPKPSRAKSAGPEPPPRPPPKPTTIQKPVAKTKTPQQALEEVPVHLLEEKAKTISSVEDQTSHVSPVRTPSPNIISSESASVEPDAESRSSEDSSTPVPISSKPRITSEEEAKAALAEKRRLAREQAEREAELERQRQEELRCQEQERKRQEEEEQRRQEEEQIKLAELHRQMEEEKFRRAIEEQKQREEEDRLRKEEETRLKAEKEEQERKAREEAEKQRIELEEKLRKEEAERAERKKRVEQIMSRTRGKSAIISGQAPSNIIQPVSHSDSKSTSPVEEVKTLPVERHLVDETTPLSAELQNVDSQVMSSGDRINTNGKVDYFQTSNEQDTYFKMQSTVVNLPPIQHDMITEIPSTVVSSDDACNKSEQIISSKDPLSLGVLEDGAITKNGLPSGEDYNLIKTSSSNNFTHQSLTNSEQMFEGTVQTNGYSSHEEEMSYTDGTSPEEKSDKSETSVGLIDFNCEQPFPSHTSSEQTEFEQLIDLGATPPITNESVDNMLNNADDVNSNKLPGNPFIAFEDNVSKKQESSSLTDLLS